TDGTVSGTGSSATFTALAGGTTANPDALAPQHYVYAEGHSIATLGANGTIQLSDGLSAPAVTASSNEYTVQAGDTLQSIAQDVYGNATLWYVIADANAISLDSSGNAINLVAGTTLKLPAVRNSQNSSQTFTPYNPLKLIGSTTPALAYIPPPPQQHCNTLADLIVVAVTAFVAPELEPYLAGALGGSAVAGWAAAGFAANTAGQLGADAVGVSNGYSFSAAVIAGIGDGVTGPLSAGLASQGDSFSIWANRAGQLEPAGEAVLGASGYAASVAAARIIGEPTQFSWAGMAAAALGATAATTLGLPSASDVALGQGPSFAADVAGGVLDSAVTREASLALGDTRV
ncbi:MAG: LysM peptidoglycan-binding domain-containing protein, partial [Betaproteobacteria bacterium]|nr:LysM peptidoglycan-binding domain-containing protein [Betaproteobacteria bacterium]